MKTSYKLAAFIILCISIASCKKVINLKLGNTSPQLVIEGNLTDIVGTQSITISQSVAFDNTNTFPPVSGAIVKIIDYNGRVYNLTERAAGTYTINSLFGRYTQPYTLQVQVNGQTYTAKSTMPSRVNLDSLSVTTQSFGKSTTNTIGISFQDSPNIKNQYRFILYVNGVQVNSVFVRNDQFSDGRFVQALLYQDDIKINSGDKVNVEMQCIDPAMYTYWYTFSQQSNGFSNSATPTNPPNNFDKPVLGYFSAHTVQRRSITIP
ncbi:DUF4249 domain-containing protein [Mucilaginibacter sp.]|uniref:DUF4249 domain-containing protein n=1 Tax=Mucilaginibacter sp. TaxID=1882438 RepID=UPI002637CE64|nr:DUF4249 domain-containing protein [Mucilaginibacter sp.]MDB4926377.1 hypothetical protein [Mucilaginibacter sp.]